MEFGVEQPKSVCGEGKDIFQRRSGISFFLLSNKEHIFFFFLLADYSRALMLSPDHERNAHHEIRLEN